MERRDFLKVGCGICLLGVAGIAIPGLITPSHASTSSFPGVINAQNQIIIPMDQFNSVDFLTVNVRAWSANVVVHKLTDGSFIALLLLCTHMENNLQSTGRGYRCSEHGSTYDLDGNVTVGPAEDPLTRFPVSVQDNNVILNVANGAP